MSGKDVEALFLREKECEKQEKENLLSFIKKDLKIIIDKTANNYITDGWSFESSLNERDYWILLISNKNTDFANSKLIDAKISISPMFGDDKNRQGLGEKFGLSYRGICHVVPKSSLVYSFESIINQLLSGKNSLIV